MIRKRMPVSEKIVLQQSPIALCQTSSHMEAGAALRQIGKPRRFAALGGRRVAAGGR
jgi:hypothetical protein